MRPLFILLVVLLSMPAAAQDFEALFENLPCVGSWAEYRITRSPSKGTQPEVIRISVTRSERIGGDEYLLVELHPFSFKALTQKKGTLGFLLKKDAGRAEMENFIIRTEKLLFAPDGGEPYEVEESLMDQIRGESREIALRRERSETGKLVVELFDGVSREARVESVKITRRSADGSRVPVNEDYSGTLTTCPEVPFSIVKETLLIRRYAEDGSLKKEKTLSVELQRFGRDGVKSAFPEGRLKKKGIWGIIFS